MVEVKKPRTLAGMMTEIVEAAKIATDDLVVDPGVALGLAANLWRIVEAEKQEAENKNKPPAAAPAPESHASASSCNCMACQIERMMDSVRNEVPGNQFVNIPMGNSSAPATGKVIVIRTRDGQLVGPGEADQIAACILPNISPEGLARLVELLQKPQ